MKLTLAQAYVYFFGIVAIVLIGSCFKPAQPQPCPPPAASVAECHQWEYKVQYSVPNPRPERKGEQAAQATSITPSADELLALGKDGWELVGLELEQETAYPQFDKTAVPNVRPQRLVMFFKRKSCK